MSLEGRWDRWHPEKIMAVNAGALGAYADAYRRTGDVRWRRDAADIRRWLSETMRTPAGTYRTSQDADAPRLIGERYYRIPTRAGRGAYGVPRTDDHVYARENGLVIQALLRLHHATGDPTALAGAQRAARRILATHQLPSGALRHAAGDKDAPLFLLDQVEMGRALLALHQADLDERWLKEARRIGHYMLKHLGQGMELGFSDSTGEPGVPGALVSRRPSLDGNARAARFLLTLAAIAGETHWRTAALLAIRIVGGADVIEAHWRNVGGLLLAVEQAIAPYALVELRGPARDFRVAALLQHARLRMRREPWIYVRRKEGEDTSAIVCGATFCSDPVIEPEALDDALDEALGGRAM